ncbi:hypothetical protein GCM10027615_56070 [Plantactinospora veratri]
MAGAGRGQLGTPPDRGARRADRDRGARPAAGHTLTRLLSGAMNEAALWLATSERPEDVTDTVAALTRMLTALRAT